MIRARNFNYYLSFKRIVVLSKPHRHHQTNKFDLAKFDIQWICSMPQSLIGLLQNLTASRPSDGSLQEELNTTNRPIFAVRHRCSPSI